MALYEELTAAENLRFFARVRGMGTASARCRECLELVGLDPARTTTVRGFSTGMQQRLKIAQALLHRAAGAVSGRARVQPRPGRPGLARRAGAGAAAAGTTVVLATNDRQEMSWGTRGVDLSG